jgi:hypothetical protein
VVGTPTLDLSLRELPASDRASSWAGVRSRNGSRSPRLARRRRSWSRDGGCAWWHSDAPAAGSGTSGASSRRWCARTSRCRVGGARRTVVGRFVALAGGVVQEGGFRTGPDDEVGRLTGPVVVARRERLSARSPPLLALPCILASGVATARRPRGPDPRPTEATVGGPTVRHRPRARAGARVGRARGRGRRSGREASRGPPGVCLSLRSAGARAARDRSGVARRSLGTVVAAVPAVGLAGAPRGPTGS